MSGETRLTPTSYIVLGLLSVSDEATPYDLKSAIAAGIGDLWSLQHAQLYTEPARLTEAGYLAERREEAGRRRKHYRITAKGRDALQRWLHEAPGGLAELRDLGLLKLFFGADPKEMAAKQLELHREKLADYEALLERSADAPPGPVLTLRAGIGHEREWVRFWSRLAKGETP